MSAAAAPVFQGLAAEIADAIGDDATAILLAKRGGTVIVVPARAPGSQLAGMIGEEAATRLIAAMGPGKLALPTGPARGAGGRRRRAMALLRQGASLMEVALTADVSDRTVSRWKSRLDEAPSTQFELPFEQSADPALDAPAGGGHKA